MDGAAFVLDFHHIGLATRNMVRARALLEALGYVLSDVSEVPVQRVRVCFATRENHPTIELIEPVGDDSPVHAILDKVGSTPYHLCYTTADLGRAEIALRRLKCQPLGERFVSGPLADRATRFFYNPSIGVIEVAEAR